MSIWLAIALTLVAYSLMNVGIVLLKKGATDVSRQRRQQVGWLAAYFLTPIGWWGFGINFGGYLLFLLATTSRQAPISVLQPLAAFGVVVVALLAVVYLHERFGVLEWVGVFLLLAGVVALGISAEPPHHPDALVHLPQLLIYTALVGLLGLICVGLLQLSQKQGVAELLYGLLAGVLLGLGYLHTKTLSLAWAEGRYEAVALALATMAVGLPGGFGVLLRSFYEGRALIVTSVNFVANQVIIGCGGILCLGESLPETPLALTARLGGYGAILAGLLVLAGLQAAAARRRAATPCNTTASVAPPRSE